jgi:acyl-CoA synthetase (AMP-forming)/AMP-acid ligase II
VLLQKWQSLLLPRSSFIDEEFTSSSSAAAKATEEISYGSLLLLATYVADELRRRLQLLPSSTVTTAVIDKLPSCDHDDNNIRRIGMAIPEGPFLPLFVLVIHSLNIAVAERWLLLLDENNNSHDDDNSATSATTALKYCNGVVLIPMETDEAPQRLQHIVHDSNPHLILVAGNESGDDWARMENALDNREGENTSSSFSERSSNTELIDFIELVESALSSITIQSTSTVMQKCNNNNDGDSTATRRTIEHLWPVDIRKKLQVLQEQQHDDATLQPHYSSSSSWDVAKLVAFGVTRLAETTTTSFYESTSLSNDTQSTTCNPSFYLSNNQTQSYSTIMSHIVYTSGTTGRPKGCISSLASLQHYIRVKNIAHGITTSSNNDDDGGGSISSRKINVMLASAVTFDPCFSDVLATFVGNGTLCLCSRGMLYGHDEAEMDGDDNNAVGGNGDGARNDSEEEENGNHYRGLTRILRQLQVTHVLCTPTLWAMVEGFPPNNIPSLRVVALGGEAIPMAMRRRWARKKRRRKEEIVAATEVGDNGGGCDGNYEMDRDYPRLYATYGVTEACVYQTCGEVVMEDIHSNSASVGKPLLGTQVNICRPLPEDDGDSTNDTLEMLEQGGDDVSDPVLGEVVLSGQQVDAMSSYLNLPELTSRVFVQSSEVRADSISHSHFYRTGDLGYIDKRTGELYITGRIKGDGMVKINGIRIELSEIETSIIDHSIVEDDTGLVIDCMAALTTSSSLLTSSECDDNEPRKQLIAYCILSASSIVQLGINADHLKTGVIVPQSPLLALLRARCDGRVRKGCMPSFFVIIDRLPLSPTGKRNRSALPAIEKCSIMSLSGGDGNSTSLWECGIAGPVVAEKVCEVLNLQPSQKSLVTTSSSFFVLGGDSLAATRVTRGLYARHHNVNDSRNLGGSSGTLTGPFAAKFLLQANTLGEYCEFLNSHSAFCNDGNGMEGGSGIKTADLNSGDTRNQPVTLFESLVESITLGHSNVSKGLLDYVDPNLQPIKARLGKVKDRKEQRSLLKSNPLHLACIRGDPILVRALLAKGCKANQPDSSGSFPIHLACSHLEKAADSDEEDVARRECVKMLLSAGTPIAIKDGNKQTILHSAARSGHIKLLRFIMSEWRKASDAPNGIKFKSHGNLGSIFDWTDRWYRTPVHWAILNRRITALRVLLEGGCSASPPRPKLGVSKRSTSVLIETPIEMSQRLYGEMDDIGKEVITLLQNAMRS